jgi:hypothetical protein
MSSRLCFIFLGWLWLLSTGGGHFGDNTSRALAEYIPYDLGDLRPFQVAVILYR